LRRVEAEQFGATLGDVQQAVDAAQARVVEQALTGFLVDHEFAVLGDEVPRLDHLEHTLGQVVEPVQLRLARGDGQRRHRRVDLGLDAPVHGGLAQRPRRLTCRHRGHRESGDLALAVTLLRERRRALDLPVPRCRSARAGHRRLAVHASQREGRAGLLHPSTDPRHDAGGGHHRPGTGPPASG